MLHIRRETLIRNACTVCEFLRLHTVLALDYDLFDASFGDIREFYHDAVPLAVFKKFIEATLWVSIIGAFKALRKPESNLHRTEYRVEFQRNVDGCFSALHHQQIVMEDVDNETDDVLENVVPYADKDAVISIDLDTESRLIVDKFMDMLARP
jgi:hypothetical protein